MISTPVVFDDSGSAIAFAFPQFRLGKQAIIGYPFYPISQKLEEFASLPTGWHFGEGVGPSPATISMARDASLFLSELGVSKQDCFPGVFGEIRVTGYLNDLYIEITFENNATSSLVIEKSSETKFQLEEATSQQLKQNIRHYVEAEQWNMSAYFAASIGMQTSIDFKVSLLETPPMEAAFP